MTTNALIERLAMLACGAEPYDTEQGICSDIEWRVGAFDLLIFVWKKNGIKWIDPLGDYSTPGNHWTGTRGRRRRALCRRTVYWLVSKYGYDGEWCK